MPSWYDSRQRRVVVMLLNQLLHPTTLKANVWTHFGFRCKTGTEEVDRSHVVCKLCKSVLKYCNNMNRHKHLSQIHAVVLQPVAKAKSVDRKEMQLDKSFVNYIQALCAHRRKVSGDLHL